MGFHYFVNGVGRYIERYDPLPDYDREERRRKRYRKPDNFHERWW